MRYSLTRLAAAGVVLATAACAPVGDEAYSGAADAASIEAAGASIDSLRIHFAAAMGTGDVDAMMRNYAESAVVMPPNEPIQVGRAAIRARHQAFQDANTVELSNPSEDIFISGDIGLLRGSYSITVTPKAGGEAIRENGKYLVTWQRQADGSWLALHEMWSSNDPVPAAGF